MTRNIPPKSVYPLGIDNDYTLYLVHNTTESLLAYDNQPWAEEIDIVPVASDQSNVWASNGFGTINGELFYYDTVKTNEYGKVVALCKCARNLGGQPTQYNSIKGGSSICLRNESVVRGLVVAEHHNQLLDAIYNLEKFIGYNFDANQTTLDFRIRCLQAVPICLDDVCPTVSNFTTSTSTSTNTDCSGVDLAYNITVQGSYNNFIISFGDGTQITSSLSGTYTYAPNTKIDPVLIISNSKCQIVSTPTIRTQTKLPQPTTPSPFQIPIPECPDFPPISVISCNVEPPNIQLPPILMPCISLSALFPSLTIPNIYINIPSMIDFGPVDIPSMIDFGPVDIPSMIDFGPVDIPSMIFFGPVDIPSMILFGPVDIPSMIYFGPVDIPSIILFGPVHIPSMIYFGKAPYIPSIINFGKVPYIPSIINFGKVPYIPSTITFLNAPHIPSTITFGKAPSIPSTITFVNLPHIPSVITFGKAPSIPSTITFVNLPHIPSVITFGKAPNIPSEITFKNLPNIPSIITFGKCCTFPSMISVESPVWHKIQVEVPTWPAISITKPSWSLNCTVNVSCPSSSGGGGGSTTPLFDNKLERRYRPGRNMGHGVGFTNVEEFANRNQPQVEIDASDLINVGIPSQIEVIAPTLPRAIKLEHNLPEMIQVNAINMPQTIQLTHSLPEVIRIVSDFNIPNAIQLTATDIPKTIELVPKSIPESIRLEVPNDFPKSIFLDASGIPDTIKVTGVPETITLIHNIPSEIYLRKPDDFKVDMVYSGSPIDINVKVDMNLPRLVGSEDPNAQCVMIVPCPK
jgi:hypothetical protein